MKGGRGSRPSRRARIALLSEIIEGSDRQHEAIERALEGIADSRKRGRARKWLWDANFARNVLEYIFEGTIEITDYSARSGIKFRLRPEGESRLLKRARGRVRS